ncbi:MAG TPA: patatin-like phospholipase family protein [Thermoanaerobaculia bacterium]
MADPLPFTTDRGTKEQLEDKLALCLSGGGYRAMLFHLGVLWYLNDARYLQKLDRISSVSGGSLAAGVLGMHWNALRFADGIASNFPDLVVNGVRKIASTTIDAGSVIRGMFTPGTSIGERVIKRYRDVAFGDAQLAQLPDHPVFVINASNVQTGSLFRFTKKYIADYRIGVINNPRRSLAEAVAASSAFPPILSPSTLDFRHEEWSELNVEEAGRKPFTERIVLTDGGVYDNMGLENPWKKCKRLIVSDAGAEFQPEADQPHDFARHSIRVNSLIDNQVRSLRRRQILAAFDKTKELGKNDPHSGVFFAMWTPASKFTTSSLQFDEKRGRDLAKTPTRLSEMKPELQNRIINYGYAMAERAIRTHFDPAAFAPTKFPALGGI